MIRIDAWGTPAPKGSPKLQTRDRHGRPLKFPRVLPDSPALERWSRCVAGAALIQCMGEVRPLLAAEVPLIVGLEFRMTRPTSVSERKRPEPSVKPDLDKLVRATLDPLHERLFADDSAIVGMVARERYATPCEASGATLLVAELSEDGALLEIVRAFLRSFAVGAVVEHQLNLA